MTIKELQKIIYSFFERLDIDAFWQSWDREVFRINDYDGRPLCIINFNMTEIVCGYNTYIYDKDPPFVRDFLFDYLIRDLKNDIEVDNKIKETDEEMLKSGRYKDIGDGSYYWYIDEYTILHDYDSFYNFGKQVYNKIIQKGDILVKEKCKKEQGLYNQGRDSSICIGKICSLCPYSQYATVFDSSDWNKDIRKIFFTELLKYNIQDAVIDEFCEYLWQCIIEAYEEYCDAVVESMKLFSYWDGGKTTQDIK